MESDYELETFERRRKVDVEGQSVWVISPEDLILSKLSWAKQSPSATLNDTESVFALRFASVAPIDRLRMTSGMFDSAKRLTAASVRSAEPEITDGELRVRIFDRLYSDDFDEPTKIRLRASLRRTP